MNDLKQQIDVALKAGKPDEAVAYLAEWVSAHPTDRDARLSLAVALGDAGEAQGALAVMRALAGRLAHDGYLLAAMIVAKKGLHHAPDDASLLDVLRSIHVRGVRARAGVLPLPPPLHSAAAAPSTVKAAELLTLAKPERLKRAAQVGAELGPAGEASLPLPMPLFCELEGETFLELAKRMHHGRLPKGSLLMKEGDPGDSLLIVASGHVNVSKAGTQLAKLGPGMVLGEIALITGGARSATVTAHEDVEYFEIDRKDVEVLAQQKPQIAEELLDYCRKRLIGNLLNTSPLFKHFDDVTRYSLIDRFTRKGFQPGQRIVRAGEQGQGLFVIAAGEVQVSIDREGESVVVATLRPGDVFGESSSLHNRGASATVTATSKVAVLLLERSEIARVVEANPRVLEYLNALSSDRESARNAAMTATEFVDASDLVVA